MWGGEGLKKGKRNDCGGKKGRKYKQEENGERGRKYEERSALGAEHYLD